MILKSRIGRDAIERAHRALGALPHHEPDELTKAQAIQKLLGDIRATQSKGYSLAAIGKMLSECGIPITTGALRAYVNGAGGKKKRRPMKRGAETATDAALTRSEGNVKNASARAAVAVEQQGVTGGAQHLDLDWEPSARSGNRSAAAARLDAQQDMEDL